MTLGRRRAGAALAAGLLGGLLSGQSRDLSKPLVVVLIGPPASGKTTQAEYLNKKFGLPVLSIEDMVSEKGGGTGKPSALDRADPDLDAVLRKRLMAMDTSRGFVLDGYPATRKQADSLAGLVSELRLERPVIVQIHISDQLAYERCRMRGGPDDKPEIVAKLLGRYHKEMDFLRSYYPEADIWTIDGSRDPAGVSATLRLLIEDRTE